MLRRVAVHFVLVAAILRASAMASAAVANRMHGTGKRRNSLPKREMRAALNPAYLELLLSLGAAALIILLPATSGLDALGVLLPVTSAFS
jgi:hypothetical protein